MRSQRDNVPGSVCESRKPHDQHEAQGPLRPKALDTTLPHLR
jgi:hypothetical protein